MHNDDGVDQDGLLGQLDWINEQLEEEPNNQDLLQAKSAIQEVIKLAGEVKQLNEDEDDDDMFSSTFNPVHFKNNSQYFLIQCVVEKKRRRERSLCSRHC